MDLTDQPDLGPDPDPDPRPDVAIDLSVPIEADAAELDVPEPPVTGDDVVDEAAEGLAQVMHEPLELQVQAFERVHRTLQDRLADVEG